jgi:hypothetical protein
MALLRAILALVAFVAAYTFVFWFAFALVPLAQEPAWFVATPLAWIAAIGAAWIVWRHGPGGASGAGFMHSVLKGAVIAGAIGFSLGFFGPLLLAPDANQGPLLGLFITGPAGFVLGAMGGALYWVFRPRPPV